MDPKELYTEAGRLHHQAKAIMDEYAGKEMPAEKAAEVDRLLDACDAKTAEAKRAGRVSAMEGDLATPTNRLGASGALGGDTKGETPAEIKAFQRYIRHGQKGLSSVEAKALRADDDDAGGFLVAPQQIAAGLLKFVDDEVVIRQLATVEQIGAAESLGILTMDSDFSDADWTGEVQTGTEETWEGFGKRALAPHPLAKRIKISKTLIRKSTRPVESIVQQRLAYRYGVTLEKAYLTGDGAQKPLGLFTPSPSGIPTSRDVAMSSATAFNADDLIDAKFALKGQYQQSSSTRWIVSREFVKRVRKLKGSDNNYLWQPGLAGGQPGTILDIPYVMSEFAPNTFTTGQYVGLLGDLQFYYIVDALTFSLQVLTELYAETNQNGYIGRYEGDGMPVLAEAFVRLKLA